MIRRPATVWSVIACVAVPMTLAGIVLRPGRSAEPAPPAPPAQTTDNTATDSHAEAPAIDPLSVNATCYVCHMLFVHEEISKWHLAKEITCIRCHGLSAAHANDEDVGATKPDITYRRDQVDAMCRTECHTDHDVPAREVLARFQQRKPAAAPIVCTDCHGDHRIEAMDAE